MKRLQTSTAKPAPGETLMFGIDSLECRMTAHCINQ
jgi:hypothetical protein